MTQFKKSENKLYLFKVYTNEKQLNLPIKGNF